MVKINTFWTGGLDSTYRVCQLSFLNVEIQPFYISDSRESEQYELKAIADIVKFIQLSNRTKCKLLPLIVIKQDEILPNKQITDSFNTLHRETKIGSQYNFLARFACQNNLKLEIGFLFNPKGPVYRCIKKYGTVKEISIPISDVENIEFCELDSNRSSKDVINVFGNFHFGLPLYRMTKIQTLKAYKEMEYEEVIPMTWFCHHPRNGLPCGLCSPCVQTMEAKLSFRIPKRSRLYYYLFKTTFFGGLIYKILQRLPRDNHDN